MLVGLVRVAGWCCIFAGCHPAPTAATRPVLPSPIDVEAAEAITQSIIDYRVFTGRTAAVDSVEIRARASGYLLQTPRSVLAREETNSGASSQARAQAEPIVVVAEGEQVKVGDLLFVIDPDPYRLALEQAKGTLEAAQADLKQANQDFARAEELIQNDTISRADYDTTVASLSNKRGQVEALTATLARTQLDLKYTQVRAPIDGLLGQTLITPGNLVVADTTLLTTIVSNDPIFVDFDVDEQSVLDYRSRMLAGKVDNARKTSISIRLGLTNEDGFPHVGTIDFVNNRTDPSTGNTRIRGTFENSTGILSPGLFARVQVPFTEKHPAILIPTIAIGMDQQGRYVMVVGSNNAVERRSVELGEIVGHMTAIRGGLKQGELVVTSGLQKIRNGSFVHIVDEKAQGESK